MRNFFFLPHNFTDRFVLTTDLSNLRKFCFSFLRVNWRQALQYHDSWSDNLEATEWLRGWICWAKYDSSPRQNGAGQRRFHHTTQNSMQFKKCESFISGIFHSVCSDQSWPRVTETMESVSVDKGGTTT